VNAAAETIYEVVDPNANIIFGAVIDDKLQGEVRITVIATGFTPEAQATPPPAARVASTKRPMSPAPPPASPPPVVEPKDKSGLDIPEFLQRRRPPRS
jgi:cell division protein FtsZ